MSRTTIKILLGLSAFPLLFVGLLLAEASEATHRGSSLQPVEQIAQTFGSVQPRSLKLYFLGDSTAAGVGATRAEDTFPFLIAQQINEVKHQSVQLFDLAKSGSKAQDVLRFQVPAAESAHPEVAVIVVSANDVTHWTWPRAVENDLRSSVERLQRAGIRVVLVGTPEMDIPLIREPLRSVIRWRGHCMAERVRKVAEEKKVFFVDLAKLTGHLFGQNPRRFFSTDQFHPSGAGYGLWARAIYPEVEKAFSADLSSVLR